MIPVRSFLTTVLFFCLACLAFAHSGATGIVKERMDTMKSISAEMKFIGTILKGQSEFDAAAVAKAANSISVQAGLVVEQFPKGSLQMPTEASKEIWERWEEFVSLNEAMEARALELSNMAASANSSDALKDGFAALGKTCIQCHEAFRVKR